MDAATLMWSKPFFIVFPKENHWLPVRFLVVVVPRISQSITTHRKVSNASMMAAGSGTLSSMTHVVLTVDGLISTGTGNHQHHPKKLQWIPRATRRPQERTGSPSNAQELRSPQELPRAPRRPQEFPGVPKSSTEFSAASRGPGASRSSQELPRALRSCQERGGDRRSVLVSWASWVGLRSLVLVNFI